MLLLLLHTAARQALTFTNMLDHVSGEEQVAPTGLLHHLVQARLIDRQAFTVPSSDPICNCKNRGHIGLLAAQTGASLSHCQVVGLPHVPLQSLIVGMRSTFVDVKHDNFYLRALEGDHGHGGLQHKQHSTGTAERGLVTRAMRGKAQLL